MSKFPALIFRQNEERRTEGKKEEKDKEKNLRLGKEELLKFKKEDEKRIGKGRELEINKEEKGKGWDRPIGERRTARRERI